MTATKYPTWSRIDASRLISEEQMDGVPDFYVERDQGLWYVKWRTSAHWSGPYKTASEAMQSVDDNWKRTEVARQ